MHKDDGTLASLPAPFTQVCHISVALRKAQTRFTRAAGSRNIQLRNLSPPLLRFDHGRSGVKHRGWEEGQMPKGSKQWNQALKVD